MPGPKAAITADPLDFSDYPVGRADRRIRFMAEYVVTPRGFGAGEPFKLRGFQDEIVRGAFADRVRTALVSLPRGNGKSGLAAALALAELFVGPIMGQVLIVASDERQARIVFNLAKRMVELNPELAARVQVYRDKLVVPETGSELYPLPAAYDALQGYDPSLLIVDELHVVTREVWEAATTAAGKRPESLTLAISTPGSNEDSLMWDLVKHGRSGTDPAFYLKEYAAPEGCRVDDVDAWRIANPALADPDPFMAEDALQAVMRTTREPVFRQLRLGQWVSGVDSWLPFGVFEGLADDAAKIPAGSRVVLAFDGSASGDSTALVGCTLDDPEPHLFVVGAWENPGDKRWRVPRGEVASTVREAFAKWNVVELAADPWGWRSELEDWAQEHGTRRVLEWNTANARRMAPATDRMYQAVTTGRISHDGDPRLVQHFQHCVAKSTTLGDLVSKDKKNSPRKIDLAVASIVCLDRAAHHTKKKKRRTAGF